MNRELTGREKVMLLILIVLVMALGYYKLIFEPINDQVAAYRDSTEQEQTELTTELVRAEQLKKMESAVAELRQRGDVKPIPAYDNSKALMVELHRILASAQEPPTQPVCAICQRRYYSDFFVELQDVFSFFNKKSFHFLGKFRLFPFSRAKFPNPACSSGVKKRYAPLERSGSNVKLPMRTRSK